MIVKLVDIFFTSVFSIFSIGSGKILLGVTTAVVVADSEDGVEDL